MNRTTHYLPALLSGMAALVLTAGAAMAGQDRANSTMQKSSTPSATSTLPSANNTSSTAQTKFDSLDANNDGSISKSEALASTRLNKEFSTLDANKDNKLSMTEFMSASDLASIKVDHKSKTKGY